MVKLDPDSTGGVIAIMYCLSIIGPMVFHDTLTE